MHTKEKPMSESSIKLLQKDICYIKDTIDEIKEHIQKRDDKYDDMHMMVERHETFIKDMKRKGTVETVQAGKVGFRMVKWFATSGAITGFGSAIYLVVQWVKSFQV